MKLLLLILLLVPLTQAHEITVIHNTLEINENIVIVHNDGSLYHNLGDNYESYFRQNLRIENNAQLCLLSNITDSDPSDGFLLPAICPNLVQNLTIQDSTFAKDQAPVTKVYTIQTNQGEKVFSGEGNFSFQVDQQPLIFFSYLKLGLKHILFGVDHVFFIVGFTLIANNFSTLLKSITGFTLSHSVTLTLAALGIIFISAKIIEPLIALSIILVGILGFFKISKWFGGFWLIFTFGLFHGLGFAGAIAEIGFPKIGFVTALLGFNLGVEIGQLLIVIVAYPLLYLITSKYGTTSKHYLSGIIVFAGIYWLIMRLI